jgi:hypothetical protein
MGAGTFKPSKPFSQLTWDEVTEELTRAYAEDGEELDELTEKFDKIAAFCEDLGMPKAKTWATLVLTTAETLHLDLDNGDHLAVACMLATYQVRKV